MISSGRSGLTCAGTAGSRGAPAEEASRSSFSRIHNHLHGASGDGGALDRDARAVYQQVLSNNMADLRQRVRPGDIAIVHDPQPAGLIGALREAGVATIWRCHVGIDHPNEVAREVWEFLDPYVAVADAYVFSRESFVWDVLDREWIVVIPPSIDVFSPKNQDLDAQAVLNVLRACGILSGGCEPGGGTFARQDGTRGRVDRQAELFEERRHRRSCCRFRGGIRSRTRSE